MLFTAAVWTLGGIFTAAAVLPNVLRPLKKSLRRVWAPKILLSSRIPYFCRNKPILYPLSWLKRLKYGTFNVPFHGGRSWREDATTPSARIHVARGAVALSNSKACDTSALGAGSHDWHLRFHMWGFGIDLSRLTRLQTLSRGTGLWRMVPNPAKAPVWLFIETFWTVKQSRF